MQYLGLVVALAGCGRLAFDPLSDARVTDAVGDVALACGPAYVPQPGQTSTYRIVRTPRTWHAAEADCESDGGHLPVIDDADENQWLVSSIDEDTWLGISDHMSDGTFRWVTGVPVGFAPWDPPEPNDLGGDEDCGQLFMLNGRWNDNFCGLVMPYACECDARPAQAPRTYCNTDTDWQNCGSCGTVCGSGVCANQVCN